MMANLTINAIFATVFATLAWHSLPRGWRFLRLGWLAIRNEVANSDEETPPKQRYHMATQSNFLIAGLAWLIGGVLSAALTIMFVVFAVFNVGIL